MNKNVRQVMIPFFLVCGVAMAQTLNITQTQTFLDENDVSKVKTLCVYTDAFGRNVQNSVFLGGTEWLIDLSVYDNTGRLQNVWKAMPYTFSALPSYISGETYYGMARAFHGNTWPYLWKLYTSDPLGRVQVDGSYGGGSSAGDKTRKPIYYWYLTRTTPDFLTTAQLTTTYLNAAPINPENAKYYLTVVKGSNEAYNQEIADRFGRIIKKRTYSDANNTVAIESSYEYDASGNLITETPPSNADYSNVNPTRYWYNLVGQLIKKQTPDAGFVEYKYDIFGRQIGYQNQKQKLVGSGREYIGFVYDELSRQTAIGCADGFADVTATRMIKVNELITVYSKVFYDDISGAIELNLPRAISDSLCNTRGRVVANVAYDYTGSASANHRIVEVYSYNSEGLVETKWKIVPTLGTQKWSYRYNLQGNISTVDYYDDIIKKSNAIASSYFSEYNNLGQLVAIRNGNYVSSPRIIGYEYDKLGRVKKKRYYQGTETANVEQQYNLQDWLVAINDSVVGAPSLSYNEKMFYYDSATTLRYDGNIARARSKYGLTNGPQTIDNMYKYDNANRLVSVTNAANSQLNEAFAYTSDGRLAKKVKGSASTAGGIPYAYGYGTNKLTNNPIKNINNNFIYDPNGNIVFDKSKKMVTVYNWLDMPVLFKFYRTIPLELPDGSDLDWNTLDKLDPSTCISTVAMLYDASGNRVLKTAFNKQ